MSAASLQVIRWGSERARSGPWRGDGRVAHLAPAAGSRPLSARFVRHCAERLGAQGYDRVVTAALAPAEQAGFLASGFSVEQSLHLLAHDLTGVGPVHPPAGVRLRRAARADLEAVLAADNDAFDSFWGMDAFGIEEALSATPRARYQVAVSVGPDPAGRDAGGSDPAEVIGYAISGRAGRRGYLQRLAVARAHQGRGAGRALAIDALRWLRRWRADQCLVNTQVGNEVALTLYLQLGFRPEPTGLSVLSLALS